MPYDPIAVANSLLRHANVRVFDVSALKLQKLLYLTHGHFLGEHGIALINEQFVAWKQGPVCVSVYREFKRQWDTSENAKKFCHLDAQHRDDLVIEEAHIARNMKVVSLIAWIVEHYGQLSAPELVGLTHMSGTPWRSVYAEGKSNVILDENIAVYFRSRLPGL